MMGAVARSHTVVTVLFGGRSATCLSDTARSMKRSLHLSSSGGGDRNACWMIATVRVSLGERTAALGRTQ